MVLAEAIGVGKSGSLQYIQTEASLGAASRSTMTYLRYEQVESEKELKAHRTSASYLITYC